MYRNLGLVVLFILSSALALAVPHPKTFVANSGQWPESVLYGAHTADGFVWITSTGMIIDQRARDASGVTVARPIELTLLHSTGSARVTTRQAPGTPSVTMFRPGAGSRPAVNAASVVVHDVTKGIDLEYVWDGDHVRFNVLADAGVRIPDPLFSVKGAGTVRTTASAILLTTDLGTITMGGILAFQGSTANIKPVSITSSDHTFGFAVDRVESARPLTIDPVVYATSVHGSANEEVTSVQVNKDGNVVVSGWTTSADVSVPGGANGAYVAGTDAFVAILTPDLKTVLRWTYLGGTGNDAIRSIAVTSNGQIWATGETSSANLPFPQSALRGAYSGTIDGIVVRFSADLGTIVNGMYLAGNKEDRATSIAVSKDNNVAVCGQTLSTTGLPMASGYSSQALGGWDAFVMTMNAAGTMINTFTYYGSSGNDGFNAVTIDAKDAIVATGWTASNEYKTWPEKTLEWVPPDDEKGSEGYWKEVGSNPYDVDYNGGATDAVAVKFNPDGTIVFSAYLGGSLEDVGNAVVTDAEGDVYIVGTTRSADMPVPEGVSSDLAGGSDAFLAVIAGNGLRLRGALYHGGSGNEEGRGAVIDAAKRVIFTGSSTSTDLTSLGAGTTAAGAGGTDGFLVIQSSATTLYSTLFGWQGDDQPTSIAMDARGDVVIGGQSTSTINGVASAGDFDAFVAKWAFGTVTVRTPVAGTALCGGKQTSISWVTEELASNETFSLDVSGDDGATWTEVAAALRTKSYQWTVPMGAPSSGTYTFRVRTIHGHAALSPVYPVGVVPQISTQPASSMLCPGAAYELSVMVSGEGLAYQWRKNGIPISGATAPTYLIGAASSADEGTYDVQISNDCASSISEAATISVSATPVITQQPAASSNLNAGATLTLTVAAEGPTLTYQWQHNGTAIAPPEGTQATLVLANIRTDQQGTYRCVITSACGTATSQDALVSIVTSVNEEGGEHAARLVVAPHPASDRLNVSITDGSVLSNIMLTDVSGNVVMTASIADLTSASISVSAIAPGVYTLTAQTTSGLVKRAVVIQK